MCTVSELLIDEAEESLRVRATRKKAGERTDITPSLPPDGTYFPTEEDQRTGMCSQNRQVPETPKEAFGEGAITEAFRL